MTTSVGEVNERIREVKRNFLYNQVLNVVQKGEAGKIKCVYILICTAIFLVDLSGTSLVISGAAGVCYASEISCSCALIFILSCDKSLLQEMRLSYE